MRTIRLATGASLPLPRPASFAPAAPSFSPLSNLEGLAYSVLGRSLYPSEGCIVASLSSGQCQVLSIDDKAAQLVKLMISEDGAENLSECLSAGPILKVIESWEKVASRLPVYDTAFRINQVQSVRIRVAKLEPSSVFGGSLLGICLEDIQKTRLYQAEADAQLYNLSPRELEVWRLYSQGSSCQAISNELYIALNTVRKHLKNIHKKVGSESLGSESATSALHDLNEIDEVLRRIKDLDRSIEAKKAESEQLEAEENLTLDVLEREVEELCGTDS